MSSWQFNPKEILEVIQKYWYKPLGLIITIIASFAIEHYFFISNSTKIEVKALIYFVTGLILIVFWFYTNKLPKTKRGKVGFVVSIRSSSEEERMQIKEDFIITLQNLIKSGNVGRFFQFIIIPEHKAEKIIDIDDAFELRAKCKAHFVLYGRSRIRDIDGQKNHVLDLDGIVSHKRIPIETSKQFSIEFSELFPRRVRFTDENDLFSFQLTSEWIDSVTKYIIGIAALVSGDLEYSEQLFNEVSEIIKTKDQSFPNYKKLHERIPLRISEIHLVKLTHTHRLWDDSHDPDLIDEMGIHINKIVSEEIKDIYNSLLLQSIYYFLKNRDVELASSKLRKCINLYGENATCCCNMAFLNAYEGNLKKAIQQYRKSLPLSLSSIALAQIEDFLCWMVEEEPDKYQLYYCLGFINWKIKGDNNQAIKDFEMFLKQFEEIGNEGQYLKERELTADWLQKLKESN